MKPSDERLALALYSFIFGFFGLTLLLEALIGFKKHIDVPVPSEPPDHSLMPPAVALGISIVLLGLTVAGVRRFWKIRKDYDL